MTKAEFSYVGRHPVCGHMRAAVCDTPGDEKWTAKDVASFVAEGMVIERVRSDEVRKHFGTDKCAICEPPKPEQLTLGE